MTNGKCGMGNLFPFHSGFFGSASKARGSMELDAQKLEELREKMQAEEDFAAIWKFFFDYFGENPEFMALGRRADETIKFFLEPILESLCKQVVNHEVKVEQFILSEIPEQRFFHGPCLTDVGIAVV